MLYKSYKRRIAIELLPRFILVVMCLFYLFPFYQMVITSLKTTEELNIYPPTLWPHRITFENYINAVKYIPFVRYTLNSLIITGLVVLGSVLSNSLVAYGFSRIKWPGRDVVFYIAIATMFIPFPVTVLALFDIFAKIHWINTYLPLIVPAFCGTPFYIFLMRQFLLNLPKELSEAAYIDGAKEIQIFSKVILPLMKPSIAVVAIFAGVAAWNDFLTPLLFLNNNELYPLSIGLQFYKSQHTIEYSLLMAASTLVVIPIVIVFFSFQSFFIEGASVGSLKG